MSEQRPASVPAGSMKAAPGWERYILLGGLAGFLVALAALFVVAVSIGQAAGLSVAGCAAFGCTLTVLLSQPIGLAGIVVGVVVGAAIGRFVHRKRHSPDAM